MTTANTASPVVANAVSWVAKMRDMSWSMTSGATLRLMDLTPAPPGLVVSWTPKPDAPQYRRVAAFDDVGRPQVLDDQGGSLMPATELPGFRKVSDDAAGSTAIIPADGWRVEYLNNDGTRQRDAPLVG